MTSRASERHDLLAEHTEGCFTTSDVSQAVDIRRNSNDAGQARYETVGELLLSAVKRHEERLALVHKPEPDLTRTWNYRQYYDEAWKFAKSCVKVGLGRFRGVCVLGFNSPHWLFANLGAILAGGVGCGIYTTNNSEACRHILQITKANIVVVEDKTQLDKILKVWDGLPHLKVAVQYNGTPNTEDVCVYSWSSFLDAGDDVSESRVRDIVQSQRANQCCQIIFTSGTSGDPRGVLLSHDNVCSTARHLVSHLQMEHEVLLSYLPLSHIAAQMCDLWTTLVAGNTLHFAPHDVLKGALTQSLREVQPTKFFAVPRVWEKIAQSLSFSSAEVGSLQRRLREVSENIGLRSLTDASMGVEGNSLGFHFADFFLFKKVRSSLGLNRCDLAVSSAAPLADDVQRALWCHHVAVVQMYGLSESTGPHVVCHRKPGQFKIQSAGRTLPGVLTKMDESGEILLWGRNIMMGYLDMPDCTHEAVDRSGWLHTGDVGRFDDDGFLYVTGRIKDLLITAGGENVSPTQIEQRVTQSLPLIGSAFLVGDRRRFLSLLVTIKNEEGSLSPPALQFCRHCGSDVTTLQPITSGADSFVIKAIEESLIVVNSLATSRAQQIKKWVVLSDEFSVAGGEIGPTMKLKRKFVLQKYQQLTEDIYSEKNITSSGDYVIHSLP